MIEIFFNLAVLIVEGTCAAAANSRILKGGNRAWGLLSFFFMALFLGDLYWSLYRFFFGMTPQYFYVSEISWYAAYLMLIILLQTVRTGSLSGAKKALPLLGPLFTGACCVYFMLGGDYINNIICEVIMGILLWFALEGLFVHSGKPKEEAHLRPLYIVSVCFVIVENALWIASVIWLSESIRNPYYWIEILFMINMVCFLPALRKAVGR